jgi:hypothetical protein
MAKKPNIKRQPSFESNPYNPLHKLYKQLTRMFSGPLASYKMPQVNLAKRKDLNRHKFQSPTGLQFKKEQSSSPIDYLYTRNVANLGRMERYQEVDLMDIASPEINTTLDIYAGEITSYTEFSPVLKITSNNDEIKDLLDHLFYDILDISQNLFHWVRSCVKYGDMFLYLDIDEEIGIKAFIGIRPSEIERLEGLDEENPNYVRFQWNSAGQEFESWQMAHFRILGDDKYAPYGVSVLNGARRIYRQLDLLENYIISYRLVRSGEKRLWKIDAQGIPLESREAYVNQTISNIKENTIVDSDSGRADKRYSPFASVEKDIFMVVNGPNSATAVETLGSNSYTGDVDDIKYFRDKLFSSLKVPAAYLSQMDSVEDKGSLAQKDLMFGKTVLRIQNSIIAELKKIAQIHLYINGYRGNDLIDFQLKLNNPSRIAEMQELEQLRTRSDVAASLAEGYFGKEFIWKKIFGLSDREIVEQINSMYTDMKRDVLMQQLTEANTTDGGIGPGGGGGPNEEMGSAGLVEPEDGPKESDGILLSKPTDDEIGSLKSDIEAEYQQPAESKTGQEAKRNEEYYTSGSKGHGYTRELHDRRRTSGPRKKQMQAKYSGMKTSNSLKNAFKGYMGLKALSAGIIPESVEDPEDNEITEDLNTINENKQLIKEEKESKNKINNELMKDLTKYFGKK